MKTDRIPRFGSVAIAAVLTITCGVPAFAAADMDPIEAARVSLNRTNRYPWYDRGDDQIRRIEVAERKVADAKDNRHSKWESRPINTSFRGLSWSWTRLLSDLLTAFFWLLIVVLLAALICLASRIYLKMENRQASASPADPIAESSSDVDRVEILPFQVKRPEGDLLAQARWHYDLGEYQEAIIYLYSYMLVQLDTHQFIRLAKGKTNRQYLGEVRVQRRLGELLERTMVSFEDVFFGGRELDRQRFERCWHGLEEFHQLVGQGVHG